MDDKKTVVEEVVKPADTAETAAEPKQGWCEDMKQDLEDYLEEQGIYIRQ